MRGSRLLSIVVGLGLGALTEAATVEYTWDVTYVTANPDGFERRVIGINGQWPCPKIEASKGDTIRVHMTNRLEDQTTGIHFHGINQIGTPWQDGPSGVTQCPVPPGSRITYEFFADEAGTYWYHSHDMGQYPDGFRGPMIIHDPDDPWKGKYDDEFVVTLSDWYKLEAIDLVRDMLRPNNTRHQPPLGLAGPDNMLVNDGGPVDYPVEIGKTYRFRFINVAAIASFFIYFHNYDTRVIMQDASYVKEQSVPQFRIGPAQRYDILVTIEDRHRDFNWPFLIATDVHKDYRIKTDPPGVWPDKFNKFNVSGYMILDPELPRLEQHPMRELVPYDEGQYRSYHDEPAFGPVTKEVVLTFNSFFDEVHGNPVMGFNGKSYVPQTVPALYTAATVGEANTDPSVYGQVNPYVFEIGDVVQLVVNNNDTGIHPFHLHGHQFQVLDLPGPKAGIWETGGPTGNSADPARKDTVNVEPLSYAVLRFKVTEPGVFLFHCHIEWHVEMGLTATFIQGPEQLRDISVPEDHLQACRDGGIPTSGNAAGNSDPFDMTGFQTVRSVPYNGALWPHGRPNGPNVVPLRSRIMRSRLR